MSHKNNAIHRGNDASMKQVVYVDILFLLNTFMNYLLLLAATALTGARRKPLRLLLASALGGLFSLSIFLPELPLPLSILLKLGCCAALVFAAFPIPSARFFRRAFCCFFLANFIFAGLLLALWFAFAPNGMVYRNGAFYFDIAPLTLTLSAIACYLILTLILRFTRKNAPENHIYTLTVWQGDKQITGKALFDSGNALRESFSGAAVIVADPTFVKDILPEALRNYLKGQTDSDLESMPAVQGMRLIPYHALHGGGVLPAFRPDRLWVQNGARLYEAEQVYLAVSKKSLSSGEYVALIGTVFFEQQKERVQNNETAAGASARLGSALPHAQKCAQKRD